MWIILEGACDIYYGNLIQLFENNIRAETGCIWNAAVSGDFSKSYGVGETVADLVMALSNGYHVGQTVAYHMWEGLIIVAVSAGGGAV